MRVRIVLAGMLLGLSAIALAADDAAPPQAPEVEPGLTAAGAAPPDGSGLCAVESRAQSVADDLDKTECGGDYCWSYGSRSECQALCKGDCQSWCGSWSFAHCDPTGTCHCTCA